jgi:methionyl-tRNA formyltransferase
MTTAQAFNLIRAVADPWPNAFLKTGLGRVNVPWALPCDHPCQPGAFRASREGVLLGFADGALRINVLDQDGSRLERPTEQAAVLRGLGLPEA